MSPSCFRKARREPAVLPFDGRYSPAAITVGTIFDWQYTIDGVGNVTAIDDLITPAQSRTYDYQDIHYFLTQGDGPRGARSWTYDEIGNRRPRRGTRRRTPTATSPT